LKVKRSKVALLTIQGVLIWKALADFPSILTVEKSYNMKNGTFIYDLKYYLLISFIRLIHDIIFFLKIPFYMLHSWHGTSFFLPTKKIISKAQKLCTKIQMKTTYIEVFEISNFCRRKHFFCVGHIFERSHFF
jgi:hypothetical protein